MSEEVVPERRPMERFRSYLLLLARMSSMAARGAGSTPPTSSSRRCWRPTRGRTSSTATSAALAAWLRQALVNNLRDARRRLARQKRDVRREQSLEEAVERSSARLEGVLAAAALLAQPAGRAERGGLLRLADALAGLPEAQREAIVLHHLQGCSLAETARRLGRTDAAVAGPAAPRAAGSCAEQMTPGG